MTRKFSALIAAMPLTLALVACELRGTDGTETDTETAQTEPANDFGYETYGEDNWADSMASNDQMYKSRDGAEMSVDGERVSPDGDMAGATTPDSMPDSEERPIMQAQVVLDRNGFGPGVIDGRMGMSTRNALKGFQEANSLDVTGEMDDATEEALARWDRIPATRVVTVPASWGQITFEDVPDDPEQQAQMDNLGYESLDEKLAERFHTTVAVLQELNPGGRPAGMSGRGTPSPTGSARPSATPTPSPSASASGSDAARTASSSVFRAGQQIRVPNIGADRITPNSVDDSNWQQTLASLGVGTEQPEVTRVVVDKSEGWLKGYDAQDNLVAMFTVTTGSENDPLPLGEWGITGVARNTPFSYDPTLFWDVPDDEEPQQLPPGPNGPVGVVWIDLTKEHYGIHGTPAPETIGRAQSHGCVRLTNWDAARLAGMVSTDTEVLFQA